MGQLAKHHDKLLFIKKLGMNLTYLIYQDWGDVPIFVIGLWLAVDKIFEIVEQISVTRSLKRGSHVQHLFSPMSLLFCKYW